MATNNDFNTAYEDNVGGNSTVTGNVLANDTGIKNPKVTSVKVGNTTVTIPTTGSVSIAGTYGVLTISADGTYTYVLDNTKSAVQSLAAGQSVTEQSFRYTVNNSTALKSNLNITVKGSNDEAIITGTSTAELTEANVALSTGGTLSATDVDSSNAFVVQTNVSGDNNYGTFSIDAAGVWTYTMNSAHDEFVAGVDYSDSITVATADGTTQILSVTMHGTNDLPIIDDTGTSDSVTEIASLTATPPDPGQTLTTTGKLTINDDDAGQSYFQTSVTASPGALGSLSIDADGNWSYSVANDAVMYLEGGESKVETFTVTSQDGTATKAIQVTINGQHNIDPKDFDALGADGAQTLQIYDGSNSLPYGGSGDDTLIGSKDSNTLYGGSGNDTLIAEAGSIATLFGGSGNDTLIFNSYGNSLLNGGIGNDTMTGGVDVVDVDLFVFETDLRLTGVDTITNFVSGVDQIVLSQSIFTAFSAVPLPDFELASVDIDAGLASSGGNNVVYESSTHALYYDANGGEHSDAQQIATLTGVSSLTTGDVVLTV